MAFSNGTFTHLFSWDQDPQRQEKIINARLEAEFDGYDTALTSLREVLTAARTYYVRTDGSDSSDGLTNSAAGAFLTIQKAVNVISETLDIAGQTVTVQVGNGTYTGAVTLKNVVGYAAPGNLVIQGDTTTPTNVLISVTSADAISASDLYTNWDIKGFELRTTTSGNTLYATNAPLRWQAITFGACATDHMRAYNSGKIQKISGNYTITTAPGNCHAFCRYNSYINLDGGTCTLNGTPALAAPFFTVNFCAILEAQGVTWSHAATGTRSRVGYNGILNTNGNLNGIPGNATEAATTGGQVL